LEQKLDPYAALRFKEFNIFLFIRFILVFGWSMQFIIIEWEVYNLTKDPLSLGLIGLAEVIPAVSMALFAGHIVDQKEKKKLFVLAISAFLMIAIGYYFITSDYVYSTFSSNHILIGIYSLVFLGGFVRAFFGPIIFSLVALIVPKKIYPNAATWSSSTWQLAAVIGPAFAGFSIGWIGVNTSMACVLVSISLALILTIFIKKKPILNPKIGEPILQSLKAGLSFVYRTKAILVAITLDMVAVLFGGAIALLPIYAQDILEVGSEGFGVLRAAPAIGSVVIMFASAYIPLTKNAGKKLLIAIFVFGLSIIAFGVSSIFWLSVFALFIYGVTDGVSMIIRQTILQLKTPDEVRGRVASVNSIFIGSSNELGAFESGVAAKLIGTVPAVVFGGVMTILTVGFTALKFPKFTKLDLTEDLKESD
jgi:MFS family permease|tara:strand:- start:1252 stop:2514 length:1263 start_codon:yes stop_codon:yes gene_type:complete